MQSIIAIKRPAYTFREPTAETKSTKKTYRRSFISGSNVIPEAGNALTFGRPGHVFCNSRRERAGKIAAVILFGEELFLQRIAYERDLNQDGRHFCSEKYIKQ